MKKVANMAFVCFSLLSLAACQTSSQKDQLSNSSSSPMSRSSQATSQSTTLNSTFSSSVSQASTSGHQRQATWNESKGGDLATLMATWGQSMGQAGYTYRSPAHDQTGLINFVAENKILLDEQPIDVGWWNNPVDYEVVAIYDWWAENEMTHHIYIFTIHDNQALVLYSSQNQGTEDDKLHMTVTANTDLSQGFAEICAK